MKKQYVIMGFVIVITIVLVSTFTIAGLPKITVDKVKEIKYDKASKELVIIKNPPLSDSQTDSSLTLQEMFMIQEEALTTEKIKKEYVKSLKFVK